MLMELDPILIVWDDWNTPHVEKHGTTRDEVDFVCYGRPVRYRESYKNRTMVIGTGYEGRILTVVVGPVPEMPDCYFYVFSARPAKRKERAYYAATRRTEPPPAEL
jgi:uncharacterized DUF497 family protein